MEPKLFLSPKTVHRNAAARLARSLALAACFAAIFYALTSPISDPDFWWHLASGRWMWEQGTLMRADPFVPPVFATEASASAPFATTQYWLAQVLFYTVYAVGGTTAVVLVRSCLFTLLWVLLFAGMRSSGVGAVPALFLIYLSTSTVIGEIGYVGDRPQMWSSLLCVVLVFLLERMRDGVRWAPWALPPLMLLWSNLHGGFLLGDLIIGLYLLGGLLARRLRGEYVMLCLAALAASGCNPNGFAIAGSYAGIRLSGAGTLLLASEEQSLLSHASLLGILKRLPHVVALLLLGIASFLLPGPRALRDRLDRLAVGLLLFALGLFATRFLVFYLTVGTWIAAANLRDPALRHLGPLWQRLPRSYVRTAPVLALLGLCGLISAHWVRAGLQVSVFGAMSPRHDYQGAADFLENYPSRGTLFNDYSAGGYLLWRLSPTYRVFIHGGLPSPTALRLFRAAVEARANSTTAIGGGGGEYPYHQILRDAGIDLVVLPGCDPVSGVLINLATVLAQDREWAVVFADRSAVIFQRITASSGPLVLQFIQPTTAVYDNIIGIATAVANSEHGSAILSWRLALAYAYYAKGDLEKALALLEEYLLLRPGDTGSLANRDRVVREIRERRRQPTPVPPRRTHQQ